MSAPFVRPATGQTSTTTAIRVDGTAPGRAFDGVGAISGGGGNSRCLIDYPAPQRIAILDYLFKPDYGASLQVLKVEIGGDANSTDGSEATVEHSQGTVDCGSGYEWWLMEQAKARVPRHARGSGSTGTRHRGLVAPGRVKPCAMCDDLSVRPTLFEFAGGKPAFQVLAAAHHARCLEDPELNHPFSHTDQHPQHVERLASYWAEVLGGPPSFSGSCGDQSGVLKMHAGNGDMGDLGERFLICFDRALDDAELPADPEFRAALRAYMRWAVDDVLSYSAEDVIVVPGAPMPRWGWDGLES